MNTKNKGEKKNIFLVLFFCFVFVKNKLKVCICENSEFLVSELFVEFEEVNVSPKTPQVNSI